MYLSYWELSHIIIFCITRTLYFTLIKAAKMYEIGWKFVSYYSQDILKVL